MLHAVHEQPDIPRSGVSLVTQQGFAQQFFLGRVGRQPFSQRQLAADFGRIQRIVQRVVERFFLGDAQPINNAFQRQALPFLAGISLQKDAL